MIIAEIGINHDGDYWKAVQMIEDAAKVGCKCVKFQCHIVDDEYIPLARNITPANAKENIYDMMRRCSFDENQERTLKNYTEKMGMQYLSTPFSRAAVDRLEKMDVDMYKIGSGECNNYPLIQYIVSTGKQIILSTGMNDFEEIDIAVDIIGKQLSCILHCVSEYPTPYEHVNLKRMIDLRNRYGAPVGLSDHSIGIYTAFAALALGADIVEKHFTSDKSWPGADVPISITPDELADLIRGESAIKRALKRSYSPEQDRTADFAFASIVAIKDIKQKEILTRDNIWVKRPGGGIPPSQYEKILGFTAMQDIKKDAQINWRSICAVPIKSDQIHSRNMP